MIVGDYLLPKCECRAKHGGIFVGGQQCCNCGNCTCITGHNHDVDIAIGWLELLKKRPLFADDSYECCEMLDCILLSRSSISNQGLLYKLEEQVDDPTSGIENRDTTRLVVISGGHGSDKKLVRGAEGTTTLQGVTHGSTSCYSELAEFIDYSFYDQDCQAFGIEPLWALGLRFPAVDENIFDF